MTSLRALIDQASGYAEALYDPDDVLMSHYVAEAADGGLSIVVVSAVGGSLDDARRMIELRFRVTNMRRWVFFSEAFLVEYGPGEPTKVDPVEHPERIDVVVFDAYDVPGDRRLTATRQILPTGDTKRLLPLVIRRERAGFLPSVAVDRDGRP